MVEKEEVSKDFRKQVLRGRPGAWASFGGYPVTRPGQSQPGGRHECLTLDYLSATCAAREKVRPSPLSRQPAQGGLFSVRTRWFEN